MNYSIGEMLNIVRKGLDTWDMITSSFLNNEFVATLKVMSPIDGMLRGLGIREA
jgi:hypothetical protein